MIKNYKPSFVINLVFTDFIKTVINKTSGGNKLCKTFYLCCYILVSTYLTQN